MTEGMMALNAPSYRQKARHFGGDYRCPDLRVLMESLGEHLDFDTTNILRYPDAIRYTIHSCAWRCRLSEELYNLMGY